jgi:branched-chain amino acid transport system ATP-binding protein
MAALELRELSKSFGGITAVSDVSFDVEMGEIVGLIGPNGAGKTTLLNLVSGLIRPDAAQMSFLGHSIHNLRPDQIARLGIARTFQIPRPLRDLTVIENVMVGALFGARNCRGTREARALALEALHRVDFEHKAEAGCREISSGETKKMELARAVAMDPRLLILDEPLAGVGVRETQHLVGLIVSLARGGCGILLVEHAMHVVWDICDRVVAMHHGQKVADGEPEIVASDPKVVGAYLGEEYVTKTSGRNAGSEGARCDGT